MSLKFRKVLSFICQCFYNKVCYVFFQSMFFAKCFCFLLVCESDFVTVTSSIIKYAYVYFSAICLHMYIFPNFVFFFVQLL